MGSFNLIHSVYIHLETVRDRGSKLHFLMACDPMFILQVEIVIQNRTLLMNSCFHSYRTRDEIQEVRQTRDPITGFKQKLIDSGLMTAEELKVGQPCRN